MENIQIVREVWEKALNINGVPDNANFFTIGGHSLLGVEVCYEIKKQTGISLSLKDLLQRPVLSDFTLLLNERFKSDLPTHELNKGQITKIAPLGTHQKQAWYLEEVNPGTNMHNLPYGIRINAKIEPTKLHEAFLRVIENHPALRTTIEKGPTQVLRSMDEVKRNLFIQYHEPRSLEAAYKDMELVCREKLDTSKPPVMAVKLYKLNDEDHILLLVFHHAFFDGYSFEVFVDSLSKAYEGIELVPEEYRFTDFCLWQNEYLDSKQFIEDREFWKNKLQKGLPVLEVPTDYPRPPSIKYDGAVERFMVDKELLEGLKRKSKRLGVSLFTVFLGTYKKVLMDYSGQEEVVVGVPVMGRPFKELYSSIGCFANAVPVISEAQKDLESFFKKLQFDFANTLDNQEIPHSEMLALGTIKRDNSRSPLYQTHFSFQDFQTEFSLFGDSNYEILYIDRGSLYTDFDCYVLPGNEDVKLIMEYRTDLFAPKTVKLMGQYYLDALRFVALDKSEKWDDFRSTSHERVLSEVNNDYVFESPEEDLVESLLQVGLEYGDKTAIYFKDQLISYNELFSRAKCYAANIEANGVVPGEFIGICMKRSPDMIAAMLGAMLANVAYVPLDPYFPVERLEYMISETDCVAVVCDEFGEKKVSSSGCKKINTFNIDSEITLEDPKKAVSAVMYVIFTSGSTGRPKGVQATYSNVKNFLNSMEKAPGMKEDDIVLAHTTICFDISTLEIFLPLLVGASIVLSTKEDSIDGRALKNICEKHDVNFIQATPATWRLLLNAGLTLNRRIVALCGAEPFPQDLAKKLVPYCGSVWNMYGPTETTVWCTAYQVTNVNGPFPLGTPIENTSFYILNKEQNPVPMGAIGELYIGGAGVSIGFCRNKNLTDKFFLNDPFLGDGKMYRTGDLVRFNHEGLLEYIGRKDSQVKIRGHRVELGEVSELLQECEGVRQVVVQLREDSPGDQRLVAYVIADYTKEMDLRDFAKRKLPQYMIPSHYIFMDTFPLTPTLKVDRKRLPSPKTKSKLDHANKKSSREKVPPHIETDGILNIRPNGDKKPIILFPEFNGDYLHMGLVRRFNGHPVYGLLGRPLSKGSTQQISSYEIALGFVQNLKEANLKSPYLFAGGSEGILLAKKCAEILRIFDEHAQVIEVDGGEEIISGDSHLKMLCSLKFLEWRFNLMMSSNVEAEEAIGRQYRSTLYRLAFRDDAKSLS